MESGEQILLVDGEVASELKHAVQTSPGLILANIILRGSSGKELLATITDYASISLVNAHLLRAVEQTAEIRTLQRDRDTPPLNQCAIRSKVNCRQPVILLTWC